jgi:hypothetical protein
MAGAGKKTFTAGETLTASDVNSYLMEQSVMVFGGTAARSSAIPTPTEGMFAVTTDNDKLDYYNGSAWVPALPVGAWTSWSPVLGTGWLNGNGVWDASYTQIGKTVHVQASFTLGSTTTKGSNMTCSLPVNARVAAFQPFGAYVARGSINILEGAISGTSSFSIYVANVAGTYPAVALITATVPLTWATGDVLYFAFTYEAV